MFEVFVFLNEEANHLSRSYCVSCCISLYFAALWRFFFSFFSIFKIIGIHFRESSSVPFPTCLALNRKLRSVLSNVWICSRKEVLEVICLILLSNTHFR